MRSDGLIFTAKMMRPLLRGQKIETRRLATRVSVGDRIYAKETFRELPGGKVYYAEEYLLVDGEIAVPGYAGNDGADWRWTSPIFMPRRLSRFWAVCIERREEKLQDISEEAAKAEGAVPEFNGEQHLATNRECYRDVYRKIWNSIHPKPNDWDSNPVVQIIKFKQL